MNVATWLARAATRFTARPALLRGSAVVCSYGKLSLRVARLAGGLRQRLGLNIGDRVLLCAPNAPEYIEALLATWYAGLVAVPVNFKLHPSEVSYIVDDSGARACFVASASSGVVQNASCACIELGQADYRALMTSESAAIEERSPSDLAWLFYTSGTTGRPKGVMLTHRNLVQMALQYVNDIDAVSCEDVLLHAAPLSHGSGFYSIPYLLHGAGQAVPESGGFEPREIADVAAQLGTVSLFSAPTMIKRLVEYPAWNERGLQAIKTWVYGGGPMYLANLRAALGKFGCRLAQIYGQGESPMTITRLTKRDHEHALRTNDDSMLTSVGAAFAGVEVRVAAEDDTPQPVGVPGEILVRGDVVMQGYWAAPQASAQTLRNGWLHTGDIGSFDERGLLTLLDRSKDLIISGGSNIYPREVEEVLQRHPEVREVAVVGQADEEWGETVVAFVVATHPGQVDAQALDAWCIDNLARFKRPRAYRFATELPKNENGKVLKRQLRASLATPQ